MAAAAITLTVTARAGGGYRIEYRSGLPDGKRKALKADDIPAAPFGAGGALPPDKVARVLGDKSHQLKDLHEFGSSIAATFLAGAVGQAWRKATSQARDDHRAWRANAQGREEPILRTYLRIEPPELQILPWEVCRIDNENVFFDRVLPVTRVLGNSVAQPAPLVEWPIRVLAIIGADTGGLEPHREVRELCRRLRRHDHAFDCEVFDCTAVGQNADTVVDRLKAKLLEIKPHVLHFAGHASFEPSALQLGPDAQVASHWWVAEDISGFLNAHTGVWKLQFAFLNACRTQRPAAKANSFVRAFAERGNANAVVTMCADVRGLEAVECAVSTYAALAEGAPLDQAVATARGTVGPGKLAAYYAVVDTAVAADPLLPPPPATDRRQHLERLDANDFIREFVDRVDQRRQLLASIAKGVNVVLITGDSELGKTWFVKSSCRTLAWQGYPVVYCNLMRHKSWSEFLLTLLKGGDQPDLAPSVGKQTLDNLTQRLQSARADDKAELGHATLDALATLGTKAKPLILALDHLSITEQSSTVSSDRPTILLSFFRPIAHGDGRIRLLLSSEGREVFADEPLSGNWAPLPLTLFPATDLDSLLREMLLAKGPTEAQMAHAEEKLMPREWTAEASPRDLARMRDFFWQQMRGRGNG